MDLYEYLKRNFQRFSIYSAINLLEYIYSSRIHKLRNIHFQSSLSLENSTEILEIGGDTNSIVINHTKPHLLDYLPKFYLDQFLALETAAQTKLSSLFNVFTTRMLYLGYRVEHLNYLPTYSPSLIESILSNYGVFFKYRNQTILLHHYYTPALLKQMIEYFFNGLVICQLAMCQFRPQAVGTASKVLGKNWLGLTTYICDLTIVRVECLTLEVYYELRANGLDPILQLFTDPLELQIHHGSLKVKTILGQVKLGYATSLG